MDRRARFNASRIGIHTGDAELQTDRMASTAVLEAFDPAQFRHVIGHFMSGVAVVTTVTTAAITA